MATQGSRSTFAVLSFVMITVVWMNEARDISHIEFLEKQQARILPRNFFCSKGQGRVANAEIARFIDSKMHSNINRIDQIDISIDIWNVLARKIGKGGDDGHRLYGTCQ